MQRNTCYLCQKQGHWAKECPDKLMNKPKPSSTSHTIINDQSIPEKQCPCGGGTCIIRTSRTEKNPERNFYTCPKKLGKQCKFFQWCDEASLNQRENTPQSSYPHLPSSDQKQNIPKSPPVHLVSSDPRQNILQSPSMHLASSDQEQNIPVPPLTHLASSDKKQNTPESLYPECSCGAGICTLLTVKNGENKGRKFFVCPVKRGQGACNFFQWQDRPGNATSNNFEDDSKHVSSPTWTFDGHEEKKESYDDDVDKDRDAKKLNGIISPESAEEGLESPPSSKHYIEEEIVGLDSGVDDVPLPSIGNLRLSENNTTVVVAKSGKCFKCGKEGHWINDCLKPSNSLCFKCGRVGHWMKDCST